MPKPPKIKPSPSSPTVANFLSQGQSQSGMGQRPNKKTRPITGSSSTSSLPSLLGGL